MQESAPQIKDPYILEQHIRFTKELCEKFFEDDRNVVISEEFREEMECILR